MGRVGLWASFFAFTAATFGFKHYGKLVGVGMLIQGCTGLLKYPLLAVCLTHDYRIANALFLVLTGLEFVTILALRYYMNRRAASLLLQQVEAETLSLELTRK